MPYGFIVLFGSVVLVAYFVFATDASWIAKVLVSGVFIFGIASVFGWIAVNSLIGLFVLVGLSVFILFYRVLQEANLGK